MTNEELLSRLKGLGFRQIDIVNKFGLDKATVSRFYNYPETLPKWWTMAFTYYLKYNDVKHIADQFVRLVSKQDLVLTGDMKNSYKEATAIIKE